MTPEEQRQFILQVVKPGHWENISKKCKKHFFLHISECYLESFSYVKR
jgi:hypothetical protein